MTCQDLFSLKKKKKKKIIIIMIKYFKMSSTVVVIGTLKVNMIYMRSTKD